MTVGDDDDCDFKEKLLSLDTMDCVPSKIKCHPGGAATISCLCLHSGKLTTAAWKIHRYWFYLLKMVMLAENPPVMTVLPTNKCDVQLPG